MSDVLRVPRLLRLKEVEELTGIERWRLYDLIQRGEGPAHMRIGKTIRVSDVALARWIAKREAQTHKDEEEG